MDKYRFLRKDKLEMEYKELTRKEFFDYLADFDDLIIRSYMWSKKDNTWVEA